jgi:hypothetical protein
MVDQSTRKAPNNQNATTTTDRRIIRLVLMTYLPWNLSLQVLDVTELNPFAIKSAGVSR